LGYRSGRVSTSGGNNTFIGPFSGYTNSTGSSNVFLGYYAGNGNTTGSSNTYIGQAAQGSPTITNATAIGANANVTASNSVILGNNANVGIGTSAPTAKLHVVGDLIIADGTQGNGKVLTSDANGKASWQAAAGGIGSTGPYWRYWPCW
jgi:hypothetical protein